MLPSLGGIDVSPVVVILVIILIKDIIVRYVYPAVYWAGAGHRPTFEIWSSSWPDIAVRRTASLRSPMFRPSTPCFPMRCA